MSEYAQRLTRNQTELRVTDLSIATIGRLGVVSLFRRHSPLSKLSVDWMISPHLNQRKGILLNHDLHCWSCTQPSDSLGNRACSYVLTSTNRSFKLFSAQRRRKACMNSFFNPGLRTSIQGTVYKSTSGPEPLTPILELS